MCFLNLLNLIKNHHLPICYHLISSVPKRNVCMYKHLALIQPDKFLSPYMQISMTILTMATYTYVLHIYVHNMYYICTFVLMCEHAVRVTNRLVRFVALVRLFFADCLLGNDPKFYYIIIFSLNKISSVHSYMYINTAHR